MIRGLSARRAGSTHASPEEAVREVREQLGPGPFRLVLTFVSSLYDREAVARALSRQLAGADAVAGCTTAGEIGPDGYTEHGIAAVAFEGDVEAALIWLDLGDGFAASIERVAGCADAFEQRPGATFGLVWTDGLTFAEERIMPALYRAVGAVPLVGGSAGDDLRWRNTFVYADGEFRERSALVVLVRTTVPFEPLKIQHHLPSACRLVVTQATPAQRLVSEIDGRVAADVYAEALGVPRGALDEAVFAAHPLVLRVGDESFLRSVRHAEPDGSLRLYSGIEAGLVVHLGTSGDPLAAVDEGFRAVEARMGPLEVVIGCDCVLRRLELGAAGRLEAVGERLRRAGVVGFSTYGEQYGALHMNQTFTGVAIGSGR